MFRNLMATLLLTSLAAAPAQAYYDDYLPAPLKKSAKMLPQKTVAYDFDHTWKSEPIPGVIAENAEGTFSIKGTDKTGKSWKIEEAESRSFGGSCYVADIDKNGFDDLFFFFYTGSCGLPFYGGVAVFFDKEGKPHREEFVSRFTANKNGLQDLLQAEDGKGAYLVVQDLANGAQKGRDLGYWRWSMFRARNCKFEEVKSALGMQFPSFVWYTTKPNHLLSSNGVQLERQFQAREKSRQK